MYVQGPQSATRFKPRTFLLLDNSANQYTSMLPPMYLHYVYFT